MGKKLYVGNLSFDADNAALESWFAEYGTVESATVIIDRATNRSKGFGFVEMSSEDEVKAAIAGLDGQEKDGRAIRVAEARAQQDRPRGGSRGGGGGGYGGGRGGGGGGGGRRDRY
jgi:RNA recognition motif-containing protein